MEEIESVLGIQRTKKLQLPGDKTKFTGEIESQRGPDGDLEQLCVCERFCLCKLAIHYG